MKYKLKNRFGHRPHLTQGIITFSFDIIFLTKGAAKPAAGNRVVGPPSSGRFKTRRNPWLLLHADYPLRTVVRPIVITPVSPDHSGISPWPWQKRAMRAAAHRNTSEPVGNQLGDVEKR